MIFNMVGGGVSGGLPEFTYTGTYQFIDDGDKNWRIKFLTSGTLNFSKLGNAAYGIDVFCVGGGGGGAMRVGGGGGYTKTTKNIFVTKNNNYTITVGAGGTGYKSGIDATNGGSTAALGVTATGGYAGSYNSKGGNGGSGGAGVGNNLSGGTNGSNGSSGPGSDGNGGSANPGIGQGTTTREFEEGTLYADGGGTSGHYESGSSATANTGGGGQGSGSVNSGGAPNSGSGGSGIVIIRNHRS